MKSKTIVFLILNFGALAIGGLFTGNGVSSDWYYNINKAPWTPPGWVFGFSWTTIMICFSFYMAQAWTITDNKKRLLGLFTAQWVLNISWNPVFFYFHQIVWALVLITSLTALIVFFIFMFWKKLKFSSVLIFPYFIWLLIATSLNTFIAFKN